MLEFKRGDKVVLRDPYSGNEHTATIVAFSRDYDSARVFVDNSDDFTVRRFASVFVRRA